MGKEKESKGYIGVQKYRVECNRGSKYFKNDDKASAYFDYMTAFKVTLFYINRLKKTF